MVPWTWSLLCVPMKWRAFVTDQHIRKQGVQGAAGSVRTHNDRELEVQFGWKCPKKDAESSALAASEAAVGQKSDLPSSASGEDHALHARFCTYKQRVRRTKQRWEPTVCQDTADDNEDDTSSQMSEEKVSSTKKKNATERSFYGRDSCDEKTIEKKTHKKQ